MEWSGRAPALPAVHAGRGHRRQGARHVSGGSRLLVAGALRSQTAEADACEDSFCGQLFHGYQAGIVLSGCRIFEILF